MKYKVKKEMSIRKHAENIGFQVIGKLTRHADWEYSTKERAYTDEAGNEYYTKHGKLTIVTANGGVI